MRMGIWENEEYPVYVLKPVDPEILAEQPDAGFEVDPALVEEYQQARTAWYAVQARLGELFTADWQRKYGPG